MALDKVEPIIQENLNMQDIQPEASASPPLPLMSEHRLPRIRAQEETIEMYRRVQLYKSPPEINSIYEARAILAEDASNASANRYLGWWSLTHDEPFLAATSLERATMSSMILVSFHGIRLIFFSDPFDGQSWYLLGRAYLELHETKHPSALLLAYDCFQAAVYGNGRCPDYWLSVGVLYYLADEYPNSLDAISIVLKLSPYLPFAWYNLGILVSK